MNSAFLKPRLVGERFHEHTLPLEILNDFSALEEMIVEVAKWKFRESHPERERITRGFGKGLELHLSGIEEGSTVPVIMLVFPMLFPPQDATYFEQSRDIIIETIACAGQNRPLPLPLELLGYFDRFGRGLRGNESIEFAYPNNRVARLTPEVRKHLIKASKAEEWTDETLLKGGVSEMDQGRMSFQLKLKDGTRLKAPLTNQHLETVLQAFNNFRQGLLVAVQGVVKKDRQDCPKSIEFVEHITVLDPLDIETRLEELANLQDGWLDGKGSAPNRASLLWLAKEFDTHFDPKLPLPYLYPTPEGGIQAEWTLTDKDWEVSLEINLATKCAEWQALNLVTEECDDKWLDLSDVFGWKELGTALRKISIEENT